VTQRLSTAAPSVVLWEDDPVRRPLLAAILEAAGIAVAQPRDAESAMALAAAPEAAALVLDANVTRPSGAEFLRELRHRRRGHAPPTLALLQPGQACLRSAMRDLGAARLVSEPFDPAQLVADVLGLQGQLGGPS
jgi:DNA-binding response OmpR family regulator